MFKVYDRNKKQLDILENPISPVITNVLGGIGELKFSVPSTYNHLELEGYIRVENDHEYVIKEIVTHGTNREVMCILNIEEILGRAWATFRSQENNLQDTVNLILSGTPWTFVDKTSCKLVRNLYGSITNSYNLLQLVCTLFDVEFIFDTYEKTVTFVDKVGKDAGVYFINEINLRQLNVDTHTHKYITRVIPIGKDGLTIESVNDGKNYLENTTYTDKVIYGIWQSDKHTKAEDLKADAQKYLDEMAIPYETYEVIVHDLYRLMGYSEFEYGLGDVVTLIDGDTETRIKQRVIERTYNLLEPDKDTIHIANKDMTFEDYYKKLQTIADMTQSVIGSDGTINGGSISDGTIDGDALATDIIKSEHITANSILAEHIQSGTIIADHIVSDTITSEHIKANAIQTKHLQADSITADHIQTGAITAGSGIIADGAIGDALITHLDAGKINAGRLNTSNVVIQSDNGNMLIRDNTIQINDDNNTTRVQIGKDAKNDYNMYVCDANGQVMFDATGITPYGIQSPIIRDDMIADDAHIDGKKIDIHSVITEINDSETKINTSSLVFDDTGQNLNVKFKELIDTVDKVDEDFTSFKNTEFNVAQGKINTLIQDTQIVQNGQTYKLKDKFSSLEQTANSVISTVGSKVDKNSIISTINQTAEAIKINASKINLSGYVTISDLGDYVSEDDLGAYGSTIIHGNRIQTGTLSVNSINSNNSNPILKLFPQSDGTYCSLDATRLYEAGGKGHWIRLKWNSKNYWYVGENSAGVYLNNSTDETNGEYGTRFWVSTTHARFNVNKLMIGTGDCRIDTDGGAIRIYTTPDGGLDRGLRINNSSGRLEIRQNDLTFTNVDNNTYKTVAWSDHTHSNYASSSHTHSNYASSSHTHSNYASSSHTHDKVSYNSTKVHCYNGYIVFDAGSAYFRMDNGSNHGGAYKFYPNGGGIDLGSSYSTNNRWRYIFSQNALNTSDVKCKEDINYLDDNIARFGRNNTPFLDFIKNDFRPATYMYKATREDEGHVDADRQIGFIANDIIDTEVGQTFLYNFGTEEETDIMYSPTGYTTVVAKALQEEIKMREALENKCADLEDRLDKLERVLEGVINNGAV